jgi:hypothetical protein
MTEHNYPMTQEDFKLLEQKWSRCKYKPEYNQQLIDHLREGLSFSSFTAGTGTAYSTLLEWCKRFPAFQESREIGEKSRLQMLEKEGLKMVRGGNVVAWKFMMNQMGQHETTKVETSVEHTFATNHQAAAPIRFKRLQKLTAMNKRVKLEEEMAEATPCLDAQIVDEDLDML